MLKIEDVRVYIPTRTQSRGLKAICSLRINGAWVLHHFKIIQPPDGSIPYVLFPSVSRLNHATKKVEWREILDVPEIDRIQVRELILSAWRRKLKSWEAER